ncbi:MAG: hypothetical protein JXB32_09635 [Deltaproteobacteria bacterium]|nr:hypothetical protein [Deltaproteobacteria bacterium]
MRNGAFGLVLACLAGGWLLHCMGGMDASDVPPEDGGTRDESEVGADTPSDDGGSTDVETDMPEGPDPVCNADELHQALMDAQDGDAMVLIGAECVIEGTFEVPAGVSLWGSSGSVLATPEAGDVRRPVLTLQTGADTTAVQNLTIRSSSNYGIVAVGDGSGAVLLKDLLVEATRGVAVGLEGLASVELTNLTLDGSHTATELRRADPSLADPGVEATHGLVVVRGGHATIDGLTIRGFAVIGGVLIDDDIAWSTGVLERNGLAGLVTHGVTATLTGLELRGLRSPHAFPLDTTFDETRSWTGPPTFGAVFLGDSVVETVGVSMERGLHFGLAHDGGEATHDGLTVRECGDTGVWAQDVRSLTLQGTTDARALLEGNHFAGVMLYEPDAATITNVDVVGTEYGCHGCGTLDEVQAGDGIQVVLPKTSLQLSGIDLVDNARIGLLLDMGGASMSGVTVMDLEVSATDVAYGAYAQNATGMEEWDAAVERLGPLAGYDNALDGELLPIGGRLPPKAFPAVSRLTRGGLVGIIDPMPPS